MHQQLRRYRDQRGPLFGQVVAGAKVVLADNNNLEECNEGEVLIAGLELAAGYDNTNELTVAKFIQWNGERW